MNKTEKPDLGRRRILKVAGGIALDIAAPAGSVSFFAAATALALDQGPRWEEWGSTSSEIILLPGQEEYMRETQAIALVFPGAGNRSISKLARFLRPRLASYAPMAHVQYAKSGLDIPGIRDGLYKLKDTYGTRELFVVGNSDGSQVAGATVALLGDDFIVNTAFMDDTPPSILETRFADQARELLGSPAPSFIQAAAVNIYVNKHIATEEGTYAGLLRENGLLLQNGKESLRKLARRLERDGGKAKLFTTKHPEKNAVVKLPEAIEAHRDIFGPLFELYEVEGNEGHANWDTNPEGYDPALKAALENVRPLWWG